MAGEINVAGTRGKVFDLVFLYPIAVPIVDKDAANVVPTPSAGLPAVVAAELTTEIAELDAGTMYWRRESFMADEGMTDPEILAKVQEMYAEREASYLAKYTEQYEHAARVGLRFDALE